MRLGCHIDRLCLLFTIPFLGIVGFILAIEAYFKLCSFVLFVRWVIHTLFIIVAYILARRSPIQRILMPTNGPPCPPKSVLISHVNCSSKSRTISDTDRQLPFLSYIMAQNLLKCAWNSNLTSWVSVIRAKTWCLFWNIESYNRRALQSKDSQHQH